jgi:hypothetical protein
METPSLENDSQPVEKTNDESSPTVPFVKHHRKVFCRYGRGCTHISDPVHNERLWHPAAPHINGS